MVLPSPLTSNTVVAELRRAKRVVKEEVFVTLKTTAKLAAVTLRKEVLVTYNTPIFQYTRPVSARRFAPRTLSPLSGFNQLEARLSRRGGRVQGKDGSSHSGVGGRDLRRIHSSERVGDEGSAFLDCGPSIVDGQPSLLNRSSSLGDEKLSELDTALSVHTENLGSVRFAAQEFEVRASWLLRLDLEGISNKIVPHSRRGEGRLGVASRDGVRPARTVHACVASEAVAESGREVARAPPSTKLVLLDVIADEVFDNASRPGTGHGDRSLAQITCEGREEGAAGVAEEIVLSGNDGKRVERHVHGDVLALEKACVRVSLLHYAGDGINVVQFFPLLLTVRRSPLGAEAKLGRVAQEVHFEVTAEVRAVAVQSDHDLPAVLIDGHGIVRLGAHSSATVRAKEAKIAVADADAFEVPVRVLGPDAVAPRGAWLGGVIAPQIQACIPNGHANSVAAAVVRAG